MPVALLSHGKLTPSPGSEVFSGLRYLHGETLGRWRTADLLIGLVYLSQRGYEDSPAADLAKHGQVVGRDLNAGARRKLVVRAVNYQSKLQPVARRCWLVGLAEGKVYNTRALKHCPLSQAELRGIERCMRYCRILRERQAAAQAAVLQTMSIEPDDIYVQVQACLIRFLL